MTTMPRRQGDPPPPPQVTQISIFGLKTNHLATLTNSARLPNYFRINLLYYFKTI
jgi:hypothetical protein